MHTWEQVSYAEQHYRWVERIYSTHVHTHKHGESVNKDKDATEHEVRDDSNQVIRLTLYRKGNWLYMQAVM